MAASTLRLKLTTRVQRSTERSTEIGRATNGGGLMNRLSHRLRNRAYYLIVAETKQKCQNSLILTGRQFYRQYPEDGDERVCVICRVPSHMRHEVQKRKHSKHSRTKLLTTCTVIGTVCQWPVPVS